MTLGRRALLQVAAAVAALGGDAFAQRRQPTQDDLLPSRRPARSRCSTSPTCMRSSCRSISASRRPTSASARIAGCRRIIVGEKLLAAYKVGRNSVDAYALACTDFEDLARTYGRLGGLDRLSTLIKAIRAERGDKVLLLDGGDTWQGSYSALQTKGARHGEDHERAQARRHDRRTGSSPTASSACRS